MDKQKIVAILREEFGITTLSELNRAISEMKLIDLSPFCGVVNKSKEKEIPA